MLDWLRQNAILVAVGSVLVNLATVAISLWNARTSRQNLRLARQQFEKQWRPTLHVEVIQHAAFSLALEVTNLGKADAVLGKTLLRRVGFSETLEEFPSDRVVAAGTPVVVPVTKEIRGFLELHPPENPQRDMLDKLWARAVHYHPGLPRPRGYPKRDALEVAFSYSAAGETLTSDWFRLSVAFDYEGGMRLEAISRERRER